MFLFFKKLFAVAGFAAAGALGRVFAQFGQHAESGFRVEERNIEAFGAVARGLVDEHDTFFLGILELGGQVLHGESHVLDALAFLFDELADRAVRSGGFQKFDLGLARFEESGTHFLLGYFFDSVAFQAQVFFVKLDGFLQVAHSDTDVFDMVYFHDLKGYEVDL